jgi:hypothetical protein
LREEMFCDRAASNPPVESKNTMPRWMLRHL